MFLRTFAAPSGVCEDLQPKQPCGEVKQPIVGNALDVPEPNTISSSSGSVAMLHDVASRTSMVGRRPRLASLRVTGST